MTDMPKEIWVTPIEINQNDLDIRPEFDVEDYGQYINQAVHEAEITKRDKALEVVRDLIDGDIISYDFRESCNKRSLTDIEKIHRDALKQALAQIDEILGGKNGTE